METNNNMKDFNIAEILKYAPKGLKLYSPLLGEVRLEKVSDHDDTIVVTTKYKSERVFFEDGKYDSNGECLLFPSSNHRCWNNWQNTLFLESIGSVCVDTITGYKYILENNGTFFSDGTGSGYSVVIEDDESNYFLNSRYATPEETKEFFEELNKNGYKWDGKMVVKKEDKPKFKVGDWVMYCDKPYQITGLHNDTFTLTSCDGSYFFNNAKSTNEPVFHLWTIADAKDGDVLAAHECYVIFKEIDGLNIKCHCTYHYMGFSPSFHINTLQNKTAFHPATKEECDRLFQKMKEEGYEWDCDKKELKKITTLQPKFKVGDIIKHKDIGLINSIKKVCSKHYILDNHNTLYFGSQDMWELIASKVKPTIEEKVSILADEILALKERVKALEIQAIRQCSDKAGDNVTLKDMKS